MGWKIKPYHETTLRHIPFYFVVFKNVIKNIHIKVNFNRIWEGGKMNKYFNHRNYPLTNNLYRSVLISDFTLSLFMYIIWVCCFYIYFCCDFFPPTQLKILFFKLKYIELMMRKFHKQINPQLLILFFHSLTRNWCDFWQIFDIITIFAC